MIEHLLLQGMPVNLYIANRLAAYFTVANQINASGQIVGTYTSDAIHGFLYSGGAYTTIGVPGAMSAEAFGINASGHIVGLYQEKASDGHILTHGYFHINGTYASFDCPLTTYYTAAYGINAADHIVGNYHASGPGGTRGFLYINGFYAVIDYPSAAHTLPMGINDKDQISGTYVTGSGVGIVFHGFLWSGGTYTTIGHPSATPHTFANGINNNGQIVGSYTTASTSRGFLYNTSSGTYANIDFPSAIYTQPMGINDSGLIVGYYGDSNNRQHGFLYNFNSGTYSTLDVP